MVSKTGGHMDAIEKLFYACRKILHKFFSDFLETSFWCGQILLKLNISCMKISIISKAFPEKQAS